MSPALSVDHLDVSLGGRLVLDQVTFHLEAGQFTGLIGSNGAGKTTLLRAILGLQRPSAGRIERSGRHVGYVPQKVILDPDIPIRARDLVGLGLDGHRPGLAIRSRRRRAAAVEEMLAAVGAGALADARVGRLSGGEQQRVLIAHALVSGPRLLLLDEPLANLDLPSAQETIGLLHRIATDHGVAVLLSAHEMNPLLPVMDRVVYLADGRAVSGPVDEVIRTDVLTSLYRHPVEVLHVHGRVLVVSGDEADPAAVHHGPAIVS
ncbi:MAG TPA: metal ABC transporter ATP-binding protein [Acidimicrobiales bacterium]|nr:metal ABC transporter ATP-binding protein [Acidimicrobiales bacterium]